MRLRTVILVLFALVFTGNLFAQITSPGASYTQVTAYKDPDTGVLWPSNQQDNIYIFCSDVNNGGSLTAPGTASCTWTWGKYDPGSFQYVTFASTQVVNNLQSGGYKVTVNCGGTINCYRAWVYVNQTIADVPTINPGCEAFTINGTTVSANNENFIVYNPPADPIVIDASTQVTVCFTATHTYVSDLGFYLIAPTYGAGCANVTTPGNNGIVELLPSVAAWDDVTNLSPSVLSCSSSQMNSNCQSGNDVNNVCFTTTLPSGNPSYTACVGNLTMPFTGTYASAGPWSKIYGQQVPAPYGTPTTCGWSVQIYDCIGQDVGYFTNATITFSGQGVCGPATHNYDSNTISSTINDNSCDAVSASRYVIPPAQPYQYTLPNTIASAVWSASCGWNAAWGSTDFFANQNPVIDPPPSSNCWFYITATDNYGCIKIDSSQFVTNPTDPTINPAGPFCEDSGNQTLTAQSPGGFWSCSSSPNFIVNASTGLINPAIGAGTYVVSYTISGLCGATDTETIIVNPVITIDNLSDDCINSNQDGEVCFDVSGGSSFNIDVNGTSYPSVAPGNFCATIPSPDWFVFEIDNGLGCGTYKDSVWIDCGCPIDAGVMSQTPQLLCQGTNASSQITPGSAVPIDGNDIIVYYLHEGNLSNIVNPVEWNSTGIFTGNNVTYGQQYYISPVIGHADATTGVDMTGTFCYDINIGTPVIWYAQPSANAGSDISVCGSTAQLNAVVPTVGFGAWTSTCSPTLNYTPFNDSPVATITYNSNFTSPVNCTLTWTVTNGVCSASDQATVIFYPIPNAFAGTDFSICGLSTDLCAVLSLPAGVSSGVWSGASGTFTQTPPNCGNVEVGNYGTFTFVWEEQTGNGLCTDVDYIDVTFIQPPMPDANHNDSVCGNVYTLHAIPTITPTGNINTGIWTGPAGVTYTSTAGYSPAQKDPNVQVSINLGASTDATYVFTWTETNGICVGSDDVSINFALPPSAVIEPTTTTQNVCGNVATLCANLTGAPYTYMEWYHTFNEPAIVFTNADSSCTDMIIPTNTDIFGDSGYVDIDVYWRMKNQGCEDLDHMVIRFFQEPTAHAGVDTAACGLSIVMNAEFSISDASSRTGVWTSVSGQPSVVFSQTPPTNPNIQITASSYNNGNPYYFVWRETNVVQGADNCSTTDTIAVRFIEIPYIDAGDPIVHCGKCDIQLDAIPSSVKDSAGWIPYPGVSFTPSPPYGPISNPDALICTNFTGEFYLYWREWVDVCVVQDSVKITVIPEPIANPTVPSWNRDVCGLVYSQLTAQNPGTGSIGFWEDISHTGTTFNQQVHYTNPDTAIATFYGTHDLIWIVYNEVNGNKCYDTSAVVPITFWQMPTPDAGPRWDTACGKYFGLNGLQSLTNSSVTWSSPDGDLDFYSTNWGPVGDTIIDTVFCAPDNTWRDILLTEAVGPGGMCAANDTLTLYFSRVPVGNYVVTTPNCYGGDFTFAAIEDTLPTYDWEWNGGTINSTSNTNDHGEGPLYVSWPVNEDSVHYVCLVTTNSYLCSSPQFCDSIPEPPRVVIHFTSIDSECSKPNGSVTAWATGGLKPSGGYVYQWLEPTFTSPGSTTQLDLMYGWYTFQAIDYYNCVNVDSVYIANTGLVTSDFDFSYQVSDSLAPAAIDFDNNSVDGAHYVWYFNIGTQGNLILDNVEYGDSQVLVLDEQISLDGSASIVEETNPTFTFENGGNMWALLIAISDSGCYDTTLKYILIKDSPKLELPNVFTPNGDGINDFFAANIKSLESYTGIIFNRWGKKIYEWDSATETGWDGTIKGKGNTVAAPGVYYYIIKAVGKDDAATEFEFTGYITLIRD
jgi:trimeric autotransporter adhesin